MATMQAAEGSRSGGTTRSRGLKNHGDKCQPVPRALIMCVAEATLKALVRSGSVAALMGSTVYDIGTLRAGNSEIERGRATAFPGRKIDVRRPAQLLIRVICIRQQQVRALHFRGEPSPSANLREEVAKEVRFTVFWYYIMLT